MSKESSNVAEIAPGLYQIRVPVPIKSLGSVFAYLVRSGDHTLLIDTGWDSEESYLALKGGIESLGFSVGDLEKIVISHLHPDHFGLSARLKKEAPNCSIVMHREDAISLRDTVEKFAQFMKDLHRWIKIHGVPESDIKMMVDASSPMMNFIAPAHPDIEVVGGELIRVGDGWEFQVISTPGHTIGNLCLYDRGSEIFFSGDHVLPTITPNVSLTPLYKGGDPLGDYLASLEALKSYKTSKVLPSHEFIFTDLHERIIEIEQHHKERLEDCLHALGNQSEAVSGYVVSSRLHWYSGSWDKLSPWEKRAALMETLAHLEYLKRRGKVAEIEESINGFQRILYSRIDRCET